MKTFLVCGVFWLIQFASSQSECPQGWTRWRDEKCYSLHASFLSYEAAKQVCATKGGHLVTIKEQAQQTFLDNFIHNLSGIQDGVWLGATRVSKTDFQWEDKTHLNYAHWVPGSPSEVDGRNCVVMQSRISKLTDPEGRWRDASCTSPNYFVCESEPSWSPEEMRKVLVETRRKLGNLIQQHESLVGRHENLVENPVPIGFVYTQLPGQPVPTSLWPNIRWSEISSQFAGKFFRVVGGAAGEFGSTQDADSPTLVGGKFETFPRENSEEVLISRGSWSQWLYTGSGGNGRTFNHLSFYVSNPEIRPINTAVRIWIRKS